MAKYKLRHSSTNREFGYDNRGNLFSSDQTLGAAVGAGVACQQFALGPYQALKFTLTDATVTLALNGTSTAGGGLQIFDFAQGLIIPLGTTSNLTCSNAGGDGSFLASLGTAAAGTDGTLTSTEISFAPSTAATISSGVGTCKMESTVTTPAPGTPIDGTGTALDMYLNCALNANGTGKTSMVFNGTIWVAYIQLGDN